MPSPAPKAHHAACAQSLNSQDCPKRHSMSFLVSSTDQTQNSPITA